MSRDRDDDLFRRAMGDVVPLDGPDRAPAGPEPRPRVRVRPPPRLLVDGDSGHASGVSERQRAALRGGRVPAGMKLDLHGLRSDAARDLVRRRIADAVAAGVRCVLIVHGRGRRSQGAPVLRDAVVEVLTTPPAVGLVRAFCPALPRDGGPGAMYVLLARRPS